MEVKTQRAQGSGSGSSPIRRQSAKIPVSHLAVLVVWRNKKNKEHVRAAEEERRNRGKSRKRVGIITDNQEARVTNNQCLSF